MSKKEIMECFDNELCAERDYLIVDLKEMYDGEKIPCSITQAINKLEKCTTIDDFADILNQLLINPNHESHQYVTMLIQRLRKTSSIPYIKQVLESEFKYLDYTCSESEVIAKWFSHALAAIGTDEAINLIKEYTTSSNKGISNEMQYRLKKINS